MPLSDIWRTSNAILFSVNAVVDRSTTAADWVDVLETGWTEPRFTGLTRTKKTKFITLYPVFRSKGPWAAQQCANRLVWRTRASPRHLIQGT